MQEKLARHFTRHKIFYLFLLSYIFVLILPVAGIGAFGIMYNTDMLIRETLEENDGRLHLSVDSFERQLDSIEDIAFNLSYNRNIRAVFSIDHYVDRLLAKFDSMQEIALINATKHLAKEISVYFERDKQVLLPIGYNQWPVYVQRFPGATIPLEDILENARSSSGRKIWTTADNGASQYLVYAKSLPINEPQKGLLLAVFETDDIVALFHPGTHMDGYVLYLLDADGNTLLTNDPGNDLLTRVELDGVDKTTEIHLGGTLYNVSYAHSKYGLQYVSFTPNNLLSASVAVMRSNYFITISVCVLFGTLLALWLLRLNYRPVRKMMDSILKIGVGEETLSAGYEHVIGAVKNIADSKANLERALENQRPRVMQTIAARMMSGAYSNDTRRFQQDLSFAQINLPSDYFVVVLIHIDDYSGFSPQSGDNDLYVIQFAMVNILEEMLGGTGTLLCDPFFKTLNLVISLSGPVQEGAPPEHLINLLATMQSFTLERLQIEMSIGISNTVRGLHAILQSVTDARVALNQRFLRGNGSFSIYANLDSRAVVCYHYPLNRENQIINLMKNGNFENVSLSLEEFYHENIRSRALPLQMSRYFIYELAGTLFKVVDDMSLPLDRLGDAVQSLLIEDWIETLTMEEAYSRLLEIVRDICSYIVQMRESNNLRLVELTIDYIGQNYTDSNLSLFLIADNFSVSGSYLSRLFKEQTGTNFSDYICSLRIKKAKELLADKKLSIEKIASMVGYNSANSFIRTFKRYELITPGQYQSTVQQ